MIKMNIQDCDVIKGRLKYYFWYIGKERAHYIVLRIYKFLTKLCNQTFNSNGVIAFLCCQKVALDCVTINKNNKKAVSKQLIHNKCLFSKKYQIGLGPELSILTGSFCLPQNKPGRHEVPFVGMCHKHLCIMM